MTVISPPMMKHVKGELKTRPPILPSREGFWSARFARLLPVAPNELFHVKAMPGHLPQIAGPDNPACLTDNVIGSTYKHHSLFLIL
jgi:hypothetical protein